MSSLTTPELVNATTILAESLEACGVESGIIGGAGIALLAHSNNLDSRQTADIDAIVKQTQQSNSPPNLFPAY